MDQKFTWVETLTLESGRFEVTRFEGHFEDNALVVDHWCIIDNSSDNFEIRVL